MHMYMYMYLCYLLLIVYSSIENMGTTVYGLQSFSVSWFGAFVYPPPYQQPKSVPNMMCYNYTLLSV